MNTTTTTSTVTEHIDRIRETSEPFAKVARSLLASWLNTNDSILREIDEMTAGLRRLAAEVTDGMHARSAPRSSDLTDLLVQRKVMIERINQFDHLLSETHPNLEGFAEVLLAVKPGER